MNMSFLLILTWMISLPPDSIVSASSSHDLRVVIDIGISSLQCCTYGECYCSNLSLALEHIQSNTEIRIMSNISLHGVPQFECTNDANITIIGYNNPVVKCDHQGGLVGRNVGHIVIHGVTWDGCDQGIEIDRFVNVHIIQCDFQRILSQNSALLTLRGHGSVCINNSVFNNIANRGVYLNVDSDDIAAVPSLTVYNSAFNNATLVIIINDNNKTIHTNINVPYVVINDCSFSGNTYYSLHCKGTDYLLPVISIFSSDFENNQMSAVKAEYCDVIVQKNCSFFNNSKSAIDTSYGTINITGPVLFYNNSEDSKVASYGGAIFLLRSSMFVNKGPIKFYGNVADYGGAIYVCKNSSFYANVAALEFYSNRARFYGGVFYVESSLCDDRTYIQYFYNLLYNADVHYTVAASNVATLGGNFVYFYIYDALHCDAPKSYMNNELFATQLCNILSLHDANIFGNFTNERDAFRFWLHDLHFNFTITDCFNNLYGPAQVFICCDSCNERYKYIVDSTYNNVTMISDDTAVSCPVSEADTIKLVAIANDFNANRISVSTEIDIIISSNELAQYCDNIAYVMVLDYYNGTQWIFKCLPLSCNLSNDGYLPEGIDCSQAAFGIYLVTPGYWFSNGFASFTDQCPQGHCNGDFYLCGSITNAVFSNDSYPISDDQCAFNWTGLACGQCGGDNSIIHDSTSCVPSSQCTLKSYYGLILFFILSLLYWIVVISFIFVLLNFKFSITAGYAYGIIFYYSVLEQTVNASYVGTQNNFNKPHMSMCLSILSTIGNMKPPYQLLKLCFGKFKMIDHMFLTYFHPVIVTCLIVAIFISARNFVTVARTIGRYVNSKSICILLMLSYSSVSYTSLQLFRPLAIIYNEFYGYETGWHSYLSPTEKYFHKRHMTYCIIAMLCEVVIGIGFPFILLIQPCLTRYFNINFTSIKPVMDQLKGCYKEEYRWFAAYYLICRQLIYVLDIGTDFLSPFKYTTMLPVYILIMMVHVWLQPYKQRKLNILDSSILITLILVYIGEHTSYGSTVALWILPLVLFINCITLSSRLKYLLIPISCSGMIALSYMAAFVLLDDLPYYSQADYTFYCINFIIALVCSIILLAYLIYVSKCLCTIVIKRHQRPEYRLINLENADDSNEDSDTNDVT